MTNLDNWLTLSVYDKEELLVGYWGQSSFESYVTEMTRHVNEELSSQLNSKFTELSKDVDYEGSLEEFFIEELKYGNVNVFESVLDDLIKEFGYEISVG